MAAEEDAHDGSRRYGSLAARKIRGRPRHGTELGSRNRRENKENSSRISRRRLQGLGLTDSCATAVHTKSFSTSVLQGLAEVFATTTKICTDGGSRQARAQTLLRTTPRPSYSSGPLVTHSLADSDFHGHRPAVLSNRRLSWCPMSVELVALTLRLVHPTAPVLLTRNGPLGTLIRDTHTRDFIVQESQRSHPFKV
ncbi:hypothetical protein ALC57_18598 [Trachymyrmex cornetzi]|uniref:Uncharacterized protein n=1 Tax=Trachymyrmex cornetzi TaxID=471704 RepID=A0A151IRG1_9HYME|nr:hypothetical protein ALC57_18598 [Trachymyrmex cornetzi]